MFVLGLPIYTTITKSCFVVAKYDFLQRERKLQFRVYKMCIYTFYKHEVVILTIIFFHLI